MFFRQIFDQKLSQYSYLIGCQKTGEAAIIDPMRDVSPYYHIAGKEKLKITAALDTHIHADYVTGLRELAERGVRVYASDEGDSEWKYEWLIGSHYDYRLLKDGDKVLTGNVEIGVIHTPGHTPEHLMFSLTDKGAGADKPMGLFTGDFIFAGDVGRPDLLETAAGVKDMMKSSAITLYRSLGKFKTMPDYLQIWPGHGAGSACGKSLGAVPASTVGYELQFNPALKQAKSEEDFVRYILDGQPEPPLYFARMKQVNKTGPAVLGSFPKPEKVAPSILADLAGNKKVAVIDTRDRSVFMKGHLDSAIFSPLDRQFNTIAGSYVLNNQPVYLIIDEEKIEEAVRDLIHVGLDEIRGYLPVAEYEQWLTDHNAEKSIPHFHFHLDGDKLLATGIRVLDVRNASEFEQGHVEGAVNIPHARLLERVEEIPRDIPVYVHCSTGGRSAVAASLLQRFGHDVVYFDGEFESWYNKQRIGN